MPSFTVDLWWQEVLEYTANELAKKSLPEDVRSLSLSEVTSCPKAFDPVFSIKLSYPLTGKAAWTRASGHWEDKHVEVPLSDVLSELMNRKPA